MKMIFDAQNREKHKNMCKRDFREINNPVPFNMHTIDIFGGIREQLL